MRNPILAAAVLAAAASLPSQSFYVPTNTPTVGTCNVYPFHNGSMRYQILIRASDLGNVAAVVRGLGIAPCSTGTATYTRLTVKMANLAAPTLSTTFDANLAAGAMTVLDIPNYTWPQQANTWNDLDVQSIFVFNGVDNVVVDVVALGMSGQGGGLHRDSTHERLYVTGYSGQLTGSSDMAAFKVRLILGDATTGTFGVGCRGSNGRTPTLTFGGSSQINNTLTIDLSNGPTTMPTLLNVGTSGLLPVFPFDLGVAGAPGCILYSDSLLVLANVTNAAGTTSIPLPVPNDPTIAGLKLYFQYFSFDASANTLGMTTSNYGRAMFGL